MLNIIILLLCFSLCGCATTAKYESNLNKYIGENEDALVASWGVPNKTYTMSNGNKALEYVNKETIESGGYNYVTPQSSYQSGTIGNEPYSGTSTTYVVATEPVRKYKLFCKTTFIINTRATVESWNHQGNNCVSH